MDNKIKGKIMTKKVEPKKKVTSKPVAKVTKVTKKPKVNEPKPEEYFGKRKKTIVSPYETKREAINAGGQQMEKNVKVLPKDIPEPQSERKMCDVCHLLFEEVGLAICHVPGRMAGRVCNKCRISGHYRILDPNHPEFMNQ